MSRSTELPLASCKRIVLSGSSKDVARMGDKAATEARKQLELVIKKLAADCGEQLRLQKRSTVNMNILLHCVHHTLACRGIQDADLTSTNRKGKGQRGVPQAAVVRLFKKAAGKDVRVDEDAKAALVGLSEAFLRTLGHRGSLMAMAGKRQTIQAADVSAAARL